MDKKSDLQPYKIGRKLRYRTKRRFWKPQKLDEFEDGDTFSFGPLPFG